MTRTPDRRARRAGRAPRALVASALALALTGLTGCSLLDGDGDGEPTAAPSPAVSETPEPTQFTRDGTFQSHIEHENIDFVFNLYPNKKTPRTQLWYPKGKKHFAMTLTGYDLDQELRAPFATKRKIYLGTIQVESSTKRSDDGRSQSPLELDAEARTITFDPEPLQSPRYGMLITSPKGSLELRDLVIGSMAPETTEVVLDLTAEVSIQSEVGSTTYESYTVEERVPITIFPSDEKTEVNEVPITSS